jgi:general secretion pathway protein C
MNATLEGLNDLVTPASLAQAGKYLPRVVTVVLVALIAWQLAKLTWLVIPRPAETTPISMTPALAVASPRPLNAQKIADAHLFGVANAPADVGDVANAPQTQMTLVLSGTIASGDPTKGFAFIGESAQAAKFLKVGDMVGGAARLHSVYPDRVMLDRNGRLEALLLPHQGTGALAIRPPAMAMNSAPSRFAENVRRIAETNPAAFNEIVRPQPYMAQGVMQGFRVYPGRNRQQFAKLGLQPGDLVKAINGTPLDDPQRSNDIFNTISASDRVQLTIERNGQTQQINVNTAQISLPDSTEPDPATATPPQEMRKRDSASPEVQ